MSGPTVPPFTRPVGRAARVALVPAAGSGSRAGSALPKQYVGLAGRSLIEWTLAALLDTAELDAVFVVVSAQDEHFDQAVRAPWAHRVVRLPCGGASRADSVLNGLQALGEGHRRRLAQSCGF